MKYYAERETLFCLSNVKCIEQATERKLKKKNIYYVYTIGFKNISPEIIYLWKEIQYSLLPIWRKLPFGDSKEKRNFFLNTNNWNFDITLEEALGSVDRS